MDLDTLKLDFVTGYYYEKVEWQKKGILWGFSSYSEEVKVLFDTRYNLPCPNSGVPGSITEMHYSGSAPLILAVVDTRDGDVHLILEGTGFVVVGYESLGIVIDEKCDKPYARLKVSVESSESYNAEATLVLKNHEQTRQLFRVAGGKISKRQMAKLHAEIEDEVEEAVEREVEDRMDD